MQSPDFGSKGARSARSSRLRPMNSALPSQKLPEGVITVKRIRPTMLLLLTGILIVLVFFGAQLKIPTVSAYPSFASFNASNPTGNTCAVSGCHTGKNSSTGAVITFPSGMTSYTPGGKAIPLTITVPGTTYLTWGFQLNARLSTNLSSAGGFFTAGDNGTTSAFGPSSTFNVNWTPPPAGTTASVNFYLTGNNTSSFSTSNLFSTGMYTLTPAAAAPAADFSLSASPTSLTVTQGASGTSTISVAALNGFTGSVGLSATGMPSGVTATFSPISKTGTSTMTLAASSATATGTSTVTIKGTPGALSHSTTLSLTVNAPAPAPDFSLLASPYTLTQGGNGTSTSTVNPLNGFTGSVTLSASNVPSGVTASAFNPASTASTSVLTLSATSTATTGTYSVTITGTSGSLTHMATLNLTVMAASVPDFRLSAMPSSLTVTQGASGTSTISVASSGGFTGSVALSASGVPSGVTATFSSPSTMSTSMLTLAASRTATTGNSLVTITGTSGGLTHTATITLTVNSTNSTSPMIVSPT